MLLSFKADVFERVKSGEKIYEHRRVFPDEPVKAYLYISTPVKAIVGIMRLDNRVQIESWKKKYSYDEATLSRIDNYLSKHTVAMEITEFQMTNAISLEKLRNDLPGFVVPQMYYYIRSCSLMVTRIRKPSLSMSQVFTVLSFQAKCLMRRSSSIG